MPRTILLPPAAAQSMTSEYMEGWMDGQTYLLENQPEQIPVTLEATTCSKSPNPFYFGFICGAGLVWILAVINFT